MITQEYLKSNLIYNEETGVFTRRISNANCVKVGDVAGSLNKYRGGKTVYIRINMRGKLYMAHKLAVLYMSGIYPLDEVDHINHDGTDNRWVNLRVVTRKENCKNMKANSRNTSGFNGVYYERKISKWRAWIYIANKKTHLGVFEDKEMAILARKKALLNQGYHENHGKAFDSGHSFMSIAR